MPRIEKTRIARVGIFRRTSWLLSLVSVIQLVCFCGATPAAAGDGGGFSAPEQVVLTNGLKVLVLEDHSFPVVSSMVWYRAGARNETLGSTGVSHLVEHLLFRRVGNMRPGELAARIARAGGQFNGYTSDDFTTFFEVLPPARLELGLQIEADRMKSATFTEKDVQDEVANINREFEKEAKDPVQSLSREIRAAAFQQHPYHNPTMGWQGDVERLTAAHARSFYEHYFRPDNAVLVVVGDVKAAATIALVRKYFAALPKPAGKPAIIASTEPQQKGERRVVVKSSGKQEVLQVAYHAPAIHEPDAAALAVVEKLLNASYAGRLRTKLLDSKVCSAASARFEAKKDPGLFEITCVAAAGNGEQKLLDGLDGAVNQLRDQAAADAELKRARNQAEFAYFSERDGPYRAGFHLGYFDSLANWQNAYTWPERIRAVSAADIQRVAKRYFNPDNRVIGWVSSPNAAKVLPPKPDSAPETPPAADPKKTPHSKPSDHVHMTGYKTDDYALGPERKPNVLLAQATEAPASEPGSSQQAPAEEGQSTTVMPAGAENSQRQDTAAPAEQRVKEQNAEGASQQPANATSQPEQPAIPASADGDAVKPAERSGQAVKAVTPKGEGSKPTSQTKLPGKQGAQKEQRTKPAARTDQSVKQIPFAESAGHQATTTSSSPLPKVQQESGLRTVHQKVLSSGLTLIVFESHISPVVQILGAVKAGDAFDPPGKRGVSAVTATALNYGSTKRTRGQIAALQEDIGLPPPAMLKFEQGQETIDFQTECLSRDLGTQLSLIGEIMSSPGFQDCDVEKSKQDVTSGIKRQQDSLESKVNRALLRSLIASNSPYCPGDPVDRIKSVSKFEAADLKDFHEHFLNPGSTYLVLAGDVSINQACQVAEKAFNGWNGRSGRQLPAVQPNSKRVLRTSIPLKDKSQTLLCFGQLVPLSRNHQDYGPLLVADCALTNHPIFSRLGQLINTEPQMAAAVGSDALESEVQSIANAVEWSLRLSPEPNAVPYVVRTLQNELRNFTRNGVTAQEIAEVRRYLLGAIPVRSMSTIGAAAKNILESVLQGGEPDYLAHILTSIKGARADSVNKLIRSTFKPDQASLVVAGSSQSITAVRNQTDKPATPVAKPAGKS